MGGKGKYGFILVCGRDDTGLCHPRLVYSGCKDSLNASSEALSWLGCSWTEVGIIRCLWLPGLRDDLLDPFGTGHENPLGLTLGAEA